MKGFPLFMRPHWTSTLIALVLYPFTTAWLMKVYGLSAGMLGVIPVGMIGSFFGVLPGALAGGVFFLINVFVAYITLGNTGTLFFSDVGFLFESIILLFVGSLAGWSRQRAERQSIRAIQLESREQYLSLLNKIAQAIITSENLDAVTQMLTADLKSLLNADDCSIIQLDEDLQMTLPLQLSATADSAKGGALNPIQIQITRTAMREGRPLVVTDAHQSDVFNPPIAENFPIKSLLALPLIHRGNKLGAILV